MGKNRVKSTRDEKEKEAEVKRKIFEIRKEKMKNRRNGEKDTLPNKRRKVDEDNSHIKINNFIIEKEQKRKDLGEENKEQCAKKRKVEDSIRYGAYENVEVVTIDWEKRLEEIEEKKRMENETRDERIQAAKNLEKSWELARWLKIFFKENTTQWASSIEIRQENEKKEVEKRERLAVAAGKKNEIQEKNDPEEDLGNHEIVAKPKDKRN